MELAIRLTVQGLIIGCGYALIAIGLTMIFGLMDIANFAHGEFFVLGFYFAFTLAKMVTVFQSVVANYFFGLVIGTLATMAFAVLLDKIVFKRLREEPLLTATMATIGLSIFLAYLIQAIWGFWPRQMPTPFGLDPFVWGPFVLPPIRLFILLITGLCIVVFHVLLRRTRLGKARAGALLRYYAGQATLISGETLSNSVPGDVLSHTLKEPIGVVAAINPWNGPIGMSVCALRRAYPMA